MSDYEVATALREVANALKRVGESLKDPYSTSVAGMIGRIAEKEGHIATALEHLADGKEARSIADALNGLVGATKMAIPFHDCTGANPDAPLPVATFRSYGPTWRPECARFKHTDDPELAMIIEKGHESPMPENGCYLNPTGGWHFVGPCPFYNGK